MIAHLCLSPGCRDYAPYLGLTSAIGMWTRLGADRCRQYCRKLLAEAVQLLTSGWRTRTLVPLSMCANMALVALPAGSAEGAAAFVGASTAPLLEPQAGDGGPSVAASEGTEPTSSSPASAAPDAEDGGSEVPWTGSQTSSEAKLIQDLLHFHHRIECPIKCIQGVLYVRLSVQIYNVFEDYDKLKGAVLSIRRGASR